MVAERIEYLIQKFGLVEHPEGGWYKETYRSKDEVGSRSLMTSILFLLTEENPSNFHSIKSDEHWYFHEGHALTIHTLTENGHLKHKLGINLERGEAPYLLVEKGAIFGSSVDVTNGYALVSCAVAPGFSFEDFKLYSQKELLSQFPDYPAVIDRLTSN